MMVNQVRFNLVATADLFPADITVNILVFLFDDYPMRCSKLYPRSSSYLHEFVGKFPLVYNNIYILYKLPYCITGSRTPVPTSKRKNIYVMSRTYL